MVRETPEEAYEASFMERFVKAAGWNFGGRSWDRRPARNCLRGASPPFRDPGPGLGSSRIVVTFDTLAPCTSACAVRADRRAGRRAR